MYVSGRPESKISRMVAAALLAAVRVWIAVSFGVSALSWILYYDERGRHL